MITTYLKYLLIFITVGQTFAQDDAVRFPAEYERTKAVLLSYSSYQPTLNKITEIILTKTDAEIWAIQGPSLAPGLLSEKYKSMDCKVNSVWVRDYGPIGLINKDRNLVIFDSIYTNYYFREMDDASPSCVASRTVSPLKPLNLYLDNGNLMIDSFGNLFMSKATYLWNSGYTKDEIDDIFKEHLKVKSVHALDYAGYPGKAADGTGHIDMFVKLLDDQTVLIADADDEPYKSTFNKASHYFSSLKNPKGGRYKIIRLKGWVQEGAWYSYTNSLIVNNVVIVPSFNGREQENLLAKVTYQKNMPAETLVEMVNSDEVFRGGGGIHCITQQIPH